MTRYLILLTFFPLMFSGLGQERKIKIKTAAFTSGTTLSINQIETTEFPRVKLFTSVTRSGLPLAGLTATNFRVRENDVEQAPLRVSTQRELLSAVVLLDVSGSMKGSIEDTKTAAIGFLKTLQKNDRVQVMTFHEQISTIYALGSDFEEAEKKILQIRHRGDTALYDGVYEAVSALKNVPGRRAVIVLSDGVDDDGRGRRLSKHDLDEPLMLGIQTNIPIYTIGLGNKMDAGILKTFAGTTGAEYANAPVKSELEELYARIGQQLSSQYAIEYTTANPLDGGLREVKLDYVVPSRKPYAAPEPVLDAAGKVVSYEAPKLSEEDLGRLAQMAGVGDYARKNDLKPLIKYIEKTPPDWPTEIPAYQKATDLTIKKRESGNEFSFEAPQGADAFMESYINILKDKKWSILSQTQAGNLAVIKAYWGESEMSVGVNGKEERSEITIEYRIPTNEPIVIDKNGVEQIVAAEGRDVIIAATGGIITISGGCRTLKIGGGENEVQCDSVTEVEVLGNGNLLIFGTLGKGLLSGNQNKLSWGVGMEGKDPVIKSTGTENKVMRLE